MNENNVIAVEKAAECTKELMNFGWICYCKGFNNALKAGAIGITVGVLACAAGAIMVVIDEKRSKKKETKK